MILGRILKNKIAGNAIWIIFGKIVQAILALIINVLVARYMGPTNFGAINYAASLVAFVVPIMNLGFSNVLVQEFVTNPEKEGQIIGTSTLMSVFSSFLCIGGLTIFTFTIDKGEPVTNITVILYSLLLVFQAFELIQYWFQYKVLSKYTSIASIIAYLVVFGYKIILLITNADIYLFAISNAIDYFLIAIILLIIYKKKGGQKFSFSWKIGKKIFNNSRHYIISSLMVTLFVQTDKVMLKHMLGEEIVGYYAAAAQCACMFSFVFSAIIDSFRPLILECKKNNNIEKYEQNIQLLYGIIIYLSLLQCLSITLLANPIISILYGVEYLDSIILLSIIVWYTTFSYMGSVRNIWILAENKQKYLWLINLGGAILNILLNLLLISFLGAAGAAISTVITQAFTNIIMSLIIKPLRYNNILMIKGLNIKKMINTLKKI